jgi:outer membrane protein assembly factor BamA
VRPSLALASALAAAAVPAAAAEHVQSVRVAAPDQARLQSFVGLAPGSALDPELVRRAVELIFASGRYEDVRVELTRRPGEPGVDVVFRPVPAPLYVATRIEGDGVLSAKAAARAARLRRGEPLWPDRLERAARDVALALTSRGHLEALVEPRVERVAKGALLVLRVRAGPHVRVSSARVACEDRAGSRLSPR